MINETVRNEDDQGHRNEDNEDDRKTIDHNQGHRNEVNQGKCNLDDSILSRCEQGGTSSMGDKISLGEDMLCIDIIDQSSDLDGKVEKRLNDMVAIHHVPKINGVIPSVDEETSDHQRLLDRLQLYGLVENKVQGDGNCQEECDGESEGNGRLEGNQLGIWWKQDVCNPKGSVSY